ILLFGHLDENRIKSGNLKNDYRVYSFKVMEERGGVSRGNLYEGIKYAFDHYKGKSRVFTSSINFKVLNRAAEEEARKIEMLVQSKNVCFVNSAGNIDDAQSELANGKFHQQVWDDNPVFHPATARCIT